MWEDSQEEAKGKTYLETIPRHHLYLPRNQTGRGQLYLNKAGGKILKTGCLPGEGSCVYLWSTGVHVCACVHPCVLMYVWICRMCVCAYMYVYA